MRHVVAYQPTNLVGERQSNNEDHADNRAHQTAHAAYQSLAKVVSEKAVYNQCNDLDASTWYAVEKTLFFTVPETDDLYG